MIDTRRDLLKKAFVAPFVLSWPAMPTFAGAASGPPPPSSDTWTITYSTRGDVSHAQFYGAGAYLFLKTPDGSIPVYLQAGGWWSYLGLYGQGAAVPAGVPAISFAGGPYDQAVAVAGF